MRVIFENITQKRNICFICCGFQTELGSRPTLSYHARLATVGDVSSENPIPYAITFNPPLVSHL
jgi:hypothetical protein